MKSKKILIIVIIIIAVLGIGGAAFAYLFIATDTFKSNKELFAKYMSQNTEALQKLENSQTVQTYKNLANEDKYESNTDIKMTYSEGGEVSNPMNNLSACLNVQRDNENEYFYGDGQVLFAEEEYLEAEIIKDKELYGMRFPDVAKQFVSIKNDQNLEKVVDDIGTDSITLEMIMDILDGTTQISEEIISQDEVEALKEKYINMITETISKGTFNSAKKAMITYNNNTVKTNSYTVSLTSEQVENLITQILNNLKTETAIVKNIKDESFEEKIDEKIKLLSEEQEVPAIKITVYEKNEITIRTVLEIGLDKIIIENSQENGEEKSKIQFSKMDSEQTIEYDIELTKKTMENQESISLTADVVEGEENYKLSFLSEIQLTEKNIELSATASYKKDILTVSIVLENSVDLGNDFEKKETLSDSNNVVLNDAEEGRRKSIIDTLKTNIPLKIETRLGLLRDALGIESDNETDEIVPEYEMTQVEINKFNAKFEFYTGNEVSSENVKTLLTIVEDNLGSYEITPMENQENIEEIEPEDIKYTIKLNIERNKNDGDGIAQVLEKISDDKKYKISISYKAENQLIDYIIIEESET